MKKTLRERYEERKHEQVLAEGFMDYFKKGSTNIQMFNNTIAQLKALPGANKLPSLQKAINTAEQQFTSVVMAQQQGQQVDTNKATMISKATAFVSGMTTFISSLKNITVQLPAMKAALSDPNAATKPLSQAMTQGQNAAQGGAPAAGGASVVDEFSKLIERQLNTSGGGFFSKLKNFFTGSGAQTPLQVFKEFGLETDQLAQELLTLTGKDFNSFISASNSVKPMQLAEPQGGVAPEGNTGTTAAQRPAQASAAAPAQPTTGPQSATPAQGTAQSTGPNQRPQPAQAQERENTLKGKIPPHAVNAFNAQQLASMSNEEVRAALDAVKLALGIK